MKIVGIKVHDIRFPTSLDGVGSDAVHVDCDYSATYVEVLTESPELRGIGLSFTIGKGNELCAQCIDYFKPFVLQKTILEIEETIAKIWERCTNHSQLRWIGPEKGVVHMAVAAVFNALWDLLCKYHKKPLWKYIVDDSFIFSDDACDIDVVSIWFDHKWWKENLGCKPPGYIGSGCGIPLGSKYSSLGYTIKNPKKDKYNKAFFLY